MVTSLSIYMIHIMQFPVYIFMLLSAYMRHIVTSLPVCLIYLVVTSCIYVTCFYITYLYLLYIFTLYATYSYDTYGL